VRSNVPPTLTNFQAISASALRAAQDLQTLVQTHTASVARAIIHLEDASSNVTAFTVSLRRSGTNIEELVEANGPKVSSTLKNLETASGTVTNMLLGLQADINNGKGLVGSLFKDEELKDRAGQVSLNLVNLSSNLDVASGNLNRHGLWWMLWKPKTPKTNHPASVKPAMGQKTW
jgi:hypothetical protein